MAMSVAYDREKRLLYGVLKGPVTVEECTEVLQEIVGSDEYAADTPALWDMSEADLSSLDESLQRQLFGLRERFPERARARLAIVAPVDLVFGIARMYELSSSAPPETIQVFRSVPDAEHWLLGDGSPPDRPVS